MNSKDAERLCERGTRACASGTKRRIANKEPSDAIAIAYYQRGNSYSDLGNVEHAIEDYGQAIRLKPDYVAAYHNRDNRYDQMGRYEQALADYDRVIEIWPEFWFGLIHRGVTYTTLGKYERAFQDFDRAGRAQDNPMRLAIWT